MAKALVDRIIEFESGDLGLDDTVSLFQELVDTGMVWQLQGFYGRTASILIEEGYVNPNGNDTVPA